MGGYNPWLVALSVVLAVVSSFVARTISGCVDSASSATTRRAWEALGAAALGFGVWSAHFVGLLAYPLPFETGFHAGLTAVSVLLALCAFPLARRVRVGPPWRGDRLWLGAAALALPVVAMLHTGLAALRLEPAVQVRPGFAALGAALLLMASAWALRIAFLPQQESPLEAIRQKVGSALVMGAGIAGLHYTTMAGLVLDAAARPLDEAGGIDRTLLAVLVGAVALVFEASVLLIDAYDAFRASQAERRADFLARRLAELRDLERRRLSQELHDRIGQNLTALRLNLEGLAGELEPEAAQRHAARLRDAAHLLDDTSDVIEDMTAQLRPPMLDGHGLSAALRAVGRQFEQRHGIAVVVQGPEALPELAPEVELEIVRIVLEALTNVAKHARARRVTIAVSAEDGGGLELQVHDDGVGFEPAGAAAALRPRWGLEIMRERAQAIGAALRIGATPGGGTRIVLRLSGFPDRPPPTAPRIVTQSSLS